MTNTQGTGRLTGEAFNATVKRDQGRFEKFFTSAAEGGAYAQLPGDRIVRALVAEGVAPYAAHDRAVRELKDADAKGVPAELTADFIEQVARYGNHHNFGVATPATLFETDTSIEDAIDLMTARDRKYVNDSDELLRAGVNYDRILELERAGFPVGNIPLLKAVGGADTDVAMGWVNQINNTPKFQSWADPYAIRRMNEHGMTAEGAAEFMKAGINAFLAADFPRISLEEIKEFAFESGLPNHESMATLIWNDEHRGDFKKQIKPGVAKAWKGKFHPSEIVKLRDAGIDPAVAQDIRATDNRVDLDTIIALHNTGLEPGEFAAWKEAFKNDEVSVRTAGDHRIDIIASQKKTGVTVEQAIDYAYSGFRDEDHWKLFADAGIENASRWGQAAIADRRSDRVSGDPRAPHTAIAESVSGWAKAGGSVEKFAAARRAGIPLTQIVNYADTPATDLWAAGAEWRANVFEKDGQRGGSQRGWDWTADNYLLG